MNGENREPEENPKPGDDPDPDPIESSPPIGIIPLAAAAFTGALLGAIIGSQLG